MLDLGMPERVLTHIEHTSFTAGRQYDRWDDIEASWVYSSQYGLDMILWDRR
jgi:hypothetical protein